MKGEGNEDSEKKIMQLVVVLSEPLVFAWSLRVADFWR